MGEHVEIVGDPSRPSTRVDDPGSIDNPILSFFLDYWRAKRGGLALPLHETFVPREIRAVRQAVGQKSASASGSF